MKSLTARKLVAVLMTNGFVLSRQRGSHAIYINEKTGISVPIPFHAGNKPIHIGTFLAIVRQSKIPRERFKK